MNSKNKVEILEIALTFTWNSPYFHHTIMSSFTGGAAHFALRSPEATNFKTFFPPHLDDEEQGHLLSFESNTSNISIEEQHVETVHEVEQIDVGFDPDLLKQEIVEIAKLGWCFKF